MSQRIISSWLLSEHSPGAGEEENPEPRSLRTPRGTHLLDMQCPHQSAEGVPVTGLFSLEHRGIKVLFPVCINSPPFPKPFIPWWASEGVIRTGLSALNFLSQLISLWSPAPKKAHLLWPRTGPWGRAAGATARAQWLGGRPARGLRSPL